MILDQRIKMDFYLQGSCVLKLLLFICRRKNSPHCSSDSCEPTIWGGSVTAQANSKYRSKDNIPSFLLLFLSAVLLASRQKDTLLKKRVVSPGSEALYPLLPATPFLLSGHLFLSWLQGLMPAPRLGRVWVLYHDLLMRSLLILHGLPQGCCRDRVTE